MHEQTQKLVARHVAPRYAPPNSSTPTERGPQAFPLMRISTGFLYSIDLRHMKRLFAYLCAGLAMCVLGVACSGAQTLQQFYSFGGGSDGYEPVVLIQAQDGNFYGVTAFGGGKGSCTDDKSNTTGCGTIFRLSTSGTENVLYSFSGETDGGLPSSLVQGQDGNIYGTTLIGGQPPQSPNQCNTVSPSSGPPAAGPCCPPDASNNALGCGTIFEFTPTQAASVTPTTLYSFTGTTDGGSPGTLIEGTNSSGAELIFGTTLSCSNCFYPGSPTVYYYPSGGTIFSFALPVGASFALNTLATFSTQTAAFPNLGINANLAFPNSLLEWDSNTLYGTTQMGGETSTGGNAVCQSQFGCGGAFRFELSSSTLLDLCHFGDLIEVTPPAVASCSAALMPQPASLSEPFETSVKPLPQMVVRQSGARFPTGGDLWGFTSLPIALAADSSGNIYGTTPPGCVDTSYTPPYQPDPNCASDHPNDSVSSVQSTIFELTPPPETSNSAASVTFLYTFSGNGSSTSTPPSDGGGSIAGLTLATDGNFYGLSGDGGSSFYGLSGTAGFSSELFELPIQNGNLPNYISLAPSYSPNWMIQGDNGNFYGTSSTNISTVNCGLPCNNGDYFGSVFEVTPSSPSLKPPVGLSFNASQITVGNSATVTWTVPYAFSATSQQCYAFVEGTNASTAGSWNGLMKGSLSNDVYGNSISITPTAPGSYTYALTCGGTVSGSATLQVMNAPPGFTLSPSPMSVSIAQGGSGTSIVTVTDVGGFSGNVALAATGLPSGVTSSFAPGSAAGTQVLTLMASTSAQVTSMPVTVTVTGTSATLMATTSISLSITPQPGFTAGSGGTTSMSIAPGATTGNTGTISIEGTNGFAGTVNLSCNVTTSMTNVNDMPSCSLNPTSVSISGATAQTSMLTVATTAASSEEKDIKKLVWPTGATTLGLVVLFMVPRRRRTWPAMSGMLLLCAAVGAVGCGGGSGGGGGGGGQGGNSGTSAGTYTITVTGTSGSVSATVGTVNVTVQ